MTDAEKLAEIVAKTRVELVEKGVIKHKDKSDKLRAMWEEKGLPIFEKCQVCGKELPRTLRRVCSGSCFKDLPE